MSQIPPINLDLLGRFRLHRDNEDIRLPVGKAMLVLAFLACAHQKTGRRDRLASLFWAESDVEQARASLRQTLSRLRSALGPSRDALWSDNEEVGLSQSAWIIDIDALRQSEEHEPARLDPAWAAPFLAGVHRRDPSIDAWLEGERQQFQQIVERIFQDAIDHALEHQDAARALELGVRLSVLNPYAESVHRSLMLAHELNGDRASALRQYRTLVRLLDSGLGVTPDSETRTLFERLRQTPARESRVANARASEPVSERESTASISRASLMPGESLRLVTVLSVQRHDSRLSQADRQEVDGILRRHGAEPILSHGSETLYVFGLHGSTTLSADAACRAVQPLREITPVDGSLAFGCASGLVSLDEQGCPVGAVVQRAARLALLADNGEFIIDTAVRSQLSRPVDVEPITVRNQSGYLVCSMHAQRTSAIGKLVGRRLELGQLSQLLEECVTEGASMALVSGEAGMGKTHLLTSLADAALEREVRVLRLAFNKREAAQESLTAELARRLHDALTEAYGDLQFDDVQQDTLSQLLSHRQGSTTETHQENESQRRLDLLSVLLERLSANTPVLLIAEDCHWAEASDIQLLIDLLDRQAMRPICLVASERRENETVAEVLATRVTEARVLSLTLMPLSRAEARELVANHHTDESTQHRILDRAGGNPLFLTQLIEADLEPDAPAPISIVALVQQELDRLSERSRMSCLKAAILGPEFNATTLESVFPEIDRTELLESRMIRLQDDQWQFRHALVHEAVYALLSEDDAARLHTEIALAVRESDPAEYAHHALLSGNSQLAIHGAALASNWLLAQQRLSEGERMVDRGLAFDPTGDVRSQLLLAKSQVLRENGDIDNAIAACRQAHDCAEAANLKVQALTRTATLLKRRSEFDRAAAQLQQASSIVECFDVPDRTRAELEHEWGNNHFMRGNAARCRQHHLQAQDLANRCDDIYLQAQALGGLGDALYAEGRIRSANQSFTRCVRLAESNELHQIVIAYRIMQGFTANLLAPGEQALEVMRRAVDGAARWKHAQYEMLGRVALADALIHAGRIEESMQHVQAVRNRESRFGGQRYEPDLCFLDIIRCWAEGKLESARTLAVDGVRQFGDAIYMGPTYQAVFAALSDDASVADEALRSARVLLDQGGLAHNRVAYAIYASASHWRRGDVAMAKRLVVDTQRDLGAEKVGQLDICHEWLCQAAAGNLDTRTSAEDTLDRHGLSLLAVTHPWRMASSAPTTRERGMRTVH